MSELWYFTCEGKQMEPVTESELKQLAGTGFLRGVDLVWKEGMPEWVKADTIPGLIPATAPQSVQPSSDTVVQRQLADDGDDAVRPRRRRRGADDDELDDRPRRRREPAKGMSGLTMGLIIGGIIFVVAVAIGSIVVVAVRTHAGVPIDDFVVDLGPQAFHARKFDFKFGTLYELRVTSDKNTDVDLIIEDAAGQRIAGDISEGPNSFLQWSPTGTANFSVKVENLDPFQGNRSHVSIRSIGPSRGPVNNGLPFVFNQPQFNQPKFNFPPPNFPKMGGPVFNVPGPTMSEKIGELQIGANNEKLVTFPVAKMVQVSVDSDNPANDVDLYVLDQNGLQVASDTRISPDCDASFFAQANQTYRFRIVNLGPFPANCTLTYTQP